MTTERSSLANCSSATHIVWQEDGAAKVEHTFSVWDHVVPAKPDITILSHKMRLAQFIKSMVLIMPELWV